MEVLDTRARGWFHRCVVLLQTAQSVELHVPGWRAKRLARAVSMGEKYTPNLLSLWLMPRLSVVLEAAGQGRYDVKVRRTDDDGMWAFVFTTRESDA